MERYSRFTYRINFAPCIIHACYVGKRASLKTKSPRRAGCRLIERGASSDSDGTPITVYENATSKIVFGKTLVFAREFKRNPRRVRMNTIRVCVYIARDTRNVRTIVGARSCVRNTNSRYGIDRFDRSSSVFSSRIIIIITIRRRPRSARYPNSSGDRKFSSMTILYVFPVQIRSRTATEARSEH